MSLDSQASTRKVRRPRVVRIGPHRYAIRSERIEGDDTFGDCSPGACLIRIDPRQTASQRRDTLVHELLHALCSLTGLNEKVDEEDLVLRLSPALLDLLRRNPALVRYLTESP
jgi:hypothetical protein